MGIIVIQSIANGLTLIDLSSSLHYMVTGAVLAIPSSWTRWHAARTCPMAVHNKQPEAVPKPVAKTSTAITYCYKLLASPSGAGTVWESAKKD